MKLNRRDDRLYLGDEPFQLISGAMHYFRTHQDCWEDRLRKLKACGMNAVETYVPWNFHEPKEGEFRFEGMADLERYIRLAQEVGLYVILRPSPYICAEWEFGGLPAWLLAIDDIRLRTADPRYLEKIRNYYKELIPRMVPFQSTQGGPILAVQIENEYGSYGNDKVYLRFLRDLLIELGIDVPLFTSDGATEPMLMGGTIEGAMPTVNFGSRPDENFAVLEKYFPGTPPCCMEYWNGWFDHWGEEHHVRDPQEAADCFKEMLTAGKHVNFYMFHGGTNFGFWNGANHGNGYEPTVTSYDYDAPLTEAGDITPKYRAVRQIIKDYLGTELPEIPEDSAKVALGTVKLQESTPLFSELDTLSEPIQDSYPRAMERYGQAYGFILYRTVVKDQSGTALKNVSARQKLHIRNVRDRALIFVDGVFQGVIDRWNDDATLEIPVQASGTQIDILVENMGRVNYGPELQDVKGITRDVRLDYQFVSDWTIYPLPLDNLEVLSGRFASTNEEAKAEEPRFYRSDFELTKEQIGDTFLKLPGWTKGQVFLNGFNLGRYWERGPQETLYVPAPILKAGKNELVIFELHGCEKPEVIFQSEPSLGPETC